MQVTLLGPVSCRHDGRELPLGGAKQRAVLALLALEAGRVVSMDRLIDELWPDDPPAQAVVTLRAYVSRLRKVLAPTPARVTTRPPGWVLTLPPQTTDLARFDDLLARARAALTDAGPADIRLAITDLDEALALWSGEALGDLRDLQFARAEATRLDDLRDTALETLLNARLATGEHEVVVGLARRFVSERPYRERAWWTLMIALYRSGRQAEALETYAALRRTLADELGLDPSPALQDLERQMLRHDPVLGPPIAPPLPAWAPGAKSAPADASVDGTVNHVVRTEAGWPVVGRRRILAQLRRSVAAAAEGHGGLVVVSAPMGAGKTTVLQILEEEVTSTGGRVLHGHGLADGAAPALWPWVTVLRELVDALPVLAGDRWDEGEPAAVALAAMGPSPAGSSTGPVVPLNRSLLFRGVIDLLREAQASGPVVVLVDDAQWVDPDTRTLLTLACDELAGHGLLFVTAVRSDEPSPDLARALGSLRRDLLTRIVLDPLTEHDVAALVQAIDGRAAPPGVAAAVLERTGGNALFVTELVRLLSAERRLTTAAAAETLPAEVLDVLGRRLDRLPAATVSLLGVAALFTPGPFDLDLLAGVTGSDPEELLDASEAALLAGLLVEAGDGTGRFALSHGLVRQTLLARLSGARRVHLHAKIAAALQLRGPEQTDEVLEVARQLVLAAPAVGSAAAIPYLVAAAEDALRRSATDAAHATLTQALQLAREVPEPGPSRTWRALVQGHLDALRIWAVKAGSAQPGATTPALPAPSDGLSAAAWLGSVTAAATRGPLAWPIAEARYMVADAPVPLAESTARFALGFLSVLAGDTTTARHELDVLRQQLAGGVDIRLPGVLFHLVEDVFAYRALLEHEAGNDAAADAELAEVVRRSAAKEETRVKCDFYLTLMAAMRGDPVAARHHGDRCRRLAVRMGFGVFTMHVDQVLAWSDAMRGDPTGPGRADAANDAYWASGGHVYGPTYLLLTAEAHAEHGDQETARRRVRQATALADERGEHFLSPRLVALRTALEATSPAGAPAAVV